MELQSHPLAVMSVEEAMHAQFRLVETISRHLPDGRVLEEGDLGMAEPGGVPRTTRRVEDVLADFFGVEAAILVRGSGTGAIREAMFAAFAPGAVVIFHDAVIYHTTNVTVQAMGIRPLLVDFNQISTALAKLDMPIAGAFIQHSRQRLTDQYELAQVTRSLRTKIGAVPIIVDDNYAVFKTRQIGAQLGADLSTFSAFKVFGPEGVGVVIGRRPLIETIRDHNRSGGCQIQGPEAMAVLRGMVLFPVAAAIQAVVARRIADRLNAGEVPGVEGAVMANTEETVVLVKLHAPIARTVVRRAAELGAAPHPVGAESRYEIAPMFYRVSKAALAEYPEWAETVVRINPLRAGDDQVISILRSAVDESPTRAE